MESPTSQGPAAEMPTPVESDVEAEISGLDVEAEISRLVEQGVPKHSPKIGSDIERFRSSLERLTSSSIDEGSSPLFRIGWNPFGALTMK